MILRCLLSCCCAFAFGQPKEPDLIRCTFRALAWSAPIEDAAYTAGRRSVPLLIPSDFFSAPQTYRGSAVLKFGQLANPGSAATPSAAEKTADAELTIARRADEAYASLAKEVALLTAGAAEGPAGENLRRQAETLMAKAAEQAAAAAAARAKAQVARSARTEEAAQKATAPVAAKPRFIARGQIRLQDGGAYLLLFAEDEQGWRITALEDSPDQHPFGTLRFIHLGERPLRLRQGGRELTLTAGRPAVLRPTTDAYGYAGIELRTTDADPKPLRTLRIFPEKDARTTYLIAELPTGGLNVKAVHERRAQ
jgi:hypothetical protein